MFGEGALTSTLAYFVVICCVHAHRKGDTPKGLLDLVRRGSNTRAHAGRSVLLSRGRDRYGSPTDDVRPSDRSAWKCPDLYRDDEYITDTGHTEQPSDYCPVMAGFHYISKIFRCMSGPSRPHTACDTR